MSNAESLLTSSVKAINANYLEAGPDGVIRFHLYLERSEVADAGSY